MIKLDISTALFLYLLFSVAGVLLLWLFFDSKKGKFIVKTDEDYIWNCPICANVYVDSINEKLSKCPRCGSFNEKSHSSP